MQKYTSADTSVNKNKLPAIFKKIDWMKLNNVLRKRNWEIYGHSGYFTVFDYGCGKYSRETRDFVNCNGFAYLPYDPYNLPEWQNHTNLKETISERTLIVVCSNVLNVIDDDKEVERIHDFITSFGEFFFYNVYEGDKSGVGRETKPDCYQRNQRLDSYLRVGEVTRKSVATSAFGKQFIK